MSNFVENIIPMYPQDNIFKIYYRIGKRLPFLVKRIRSTYGDPDFFTNKKGRTFLVEKVKPGGIGGKYGTAYGKCFFDGEPNNEYREQCYPNITDDEIPCAGCGEWVLIEVPGVSMEEIFPPQKRTDKIPFGMYKGKTYGEIVDKDPRYIFWIFFNKEDLNLDLYDIFQIDKEDPDAKNRLKNIFDKTNLFIKPDDTIDFGKYKNRTWREVYKEDRTYVLWAINNTNKDFDIEKFNEMFAQSRPCERPCEGERED